MFLRVGKEDLKVSLKDTGTLLYYSGLAFLIPIAMAIIVDKSILNLIAFSFSAMLIFLCGFVLKNFINTKKETEIKHALLSTVLIWVLFTFFASLPFTLIMKISLLDAFFETMSTLTTTGLSVMVPLLDITPKSLIFWRTFLGWIGGIGIVIMALIGIVTTYSKTSKLIMAEGRGGQLKENLKTGTKKIMKIYIIFTILGVLMLMASGQDLWFATNYSMSAISTNGMDITTEGLEQVNGWNNTGMHNYFVDISLMILTLLGAMSFSLHYLVIKKKNIMEYFRDSETQLLFFINIIGAIIVGVKLGIWEGLFHSVSMSTCGGFALMDKMAIQNWPETVKAILIIITIIGGAAGSTAGGIKLGRTIIFAKGLWWRIKKEMLPEKSFFKRNFNGRTIYLEELKEVNQFILLWILLIVIGTLVITFSGYGLVDSLFEVASAQSNSGISNGISNALAPASVKIMLIINMLVGRLEIIPIMAGIGILFGLRKR